MKNKILNYFILICLILTTITSNVFASFTFNDVENHWAKQTIEELATKGIINGKENNVFDPEGNVTRAEFIKMLVSITMGTLESADGSLNDVPKTEWYSKYIYTALKEDIFKLEELNNNKFYPNNSIDRETAALWAVRLLNLNLQQNTTVFADDDTISNKAEVSAAYEAGIITGDYGHKTFRPKDTLTRAEAATIIKRVTIIDDRQKAKAEKEQTKIDITKQENEIEFRTENDIEKLKTSDYKSNIEEVDFVVNVKNGKSCKVLQLTDIQIMETEQMRTEDRLTGDTYEKCFSFNKTKNYKNYCKQVIESYKPDFIIITGDLVYGEFDDAGTALLDLIKFMDGFKIPWAPVFGNHENESAKGADWQCEQLQNSKYCLFAQRKLTGNGNYTVGIVQDNTLKRVFYMMDSNGCSSMSKQTEANGHSQRAYGFSENQIRWYENGIEKIKQTYPNVKISFAFHAQLQVFEDALQKYGFTNTNQSISIQDELDFGYIGRPLKNPWDSNKVVWNSLKATGCDSIFVGHEHHNCASVMYEGVRFQYGQKSSVYDRHNYISASGKINSNNEGTPYVGGTAIILSKDDATIEDAYIIRAR